MSAYLCLHHYIVYILEWLFQDIDMKDVTFCIGIIKWLSINFVRRLLWFSQTGKRNYQVQHLEKIEERGIMKFFFFISLNIWVKFTISKAGQNTYLAQSQTWIHHCGHQKKLWRCHLRQNLKRSKQRNQPACPEIPPIPHHLTKDNLKKTEDYLSH